jgi:hypothetical protein
LGSAALKNSFPGFAIKVNLRSAKIRMNFRDTSTRVRARVMMMDAVGEVQRGTTELAEKIREILFV